MAEHTKGKLYMSPGRRTIDICNDVSIPWVRIAHISNMSSEDIANARRLVACWNWCENLPTEFLEETSKPDSPVAL